MEYPRIDLRTAKYYAVCHGQQIIQADGKTRQERIADVKEQLDRPGRYFVFQQWIDDGMQIMEVKL